MPVGDAVEPTPLRPLLAASFRGVAAAWLWRRVEREAAEASAALARVAGQAAGRELAQALSELREAAAQWSERHRTDGPVAAGGSSEAVSAEMPAQSADMEIGTAAAAGILGVTPRRVGQQAASGVLPARKVGGQWLLSRLSVLEFRDVKGQAA